MADRSMQGAFAVPPPTADALAALLRGGRITLQLPPPTEGLEAPGRPAAKEERSDCAAGGSGRALAASDQAHVDIALTAHALSEEPKGAAAQQH